MVWIGRKLYFLARREEITFTGEPVSKMTITLTLLTVISMRVTVVLKVGNIVRIGARGLASGVREGNRLGQGEG